MTKELNGFLYSRNEIAGYALRIIIRIYDTDGHDFRVTIYTTNTKPANAFEDIKTFVVKRVEKISLEHFATKQQDDITGKFIEETLKDWN